MIASTMMVSKGTNFFDQRAMFIKDIREWICQTTELKTWADYKTFFRRYNLKQRRAVTTAGKGGIHSGGAEHILCATTTSRIT